MGKKQKIPVCLFRMFKMMQKTWQITKIERSRGSLPTNVQNQSDKTDSDWEFLVPSL